MQGVTPLYISIQNKYQEIAHLLSSKGASAIVQVRILHMHATKSISFVPSKLFLQGVCNSSNFPLAYVHGSTPVVCVIDLGSPPKII